MGGGSWSDDHYEDRSAVRAASGSTGFKYHEDIRAGKTVAKVHDKLDPAKMKDFKRECRDSAAHPKSKPIYIGLDVTGSMSSVPMVMQKKLPQLMGLLLRKGYVEDPSICISAIGDCNYDRSPFQVGQFESGIEIDDDITNLYLEGGGGGNDFESYELALYFLARCVVSDDFEKRNAKGYAFIICDESLSPVIKARDVLKVFGQTLQEDLKTADIIKEVQEKWNLYCIVPNMTSHFSNNGMKRFWKEQLGERVLLLDQPDGITEMIAGIIGVVEGNTDIDNLVNDLIDGKTDAVVAKSVGKSLTAVAGEKGISNITKGTGLATL